MTTISINNREIKLHARPKHKAVMQAQNIMTDWLMKTVDTNNVDSSVPLEVALQRAIVADPKHTLAVAQIQQTLQIDQTIMLATGMEYQDIQELREDIYEDEYHELHSKSQDVIGGTAADFFECYTTNMSLKQLVATKATLRTEINVLILKKEMMVHAHGASSPSETSANLPDGLSETSTEPSTEKESAIKG